MPGSVKFGRVKVGSPIQSAFSTASKFSSPRNAAKMYPAITPRKIEMRPRNPRKTTAKMIVIASVNVAVIGAAA